MRKDWDEYFMSIAKQVAERSTCDRAHVGCVLVKDNRIIATGYNGSPSGQPHCDDAGHFISGEHCVRTIHAELNALLQCAIVGTSSNCTTCYVTHFPCYECTKALIQAGISRMVFAEEYGNTRAAFLLLLDAKVIVGTYGEG